MPIIDQTKLPSEITSKYSIANNAFSLSKIKNAELDTYKNEPKDEINIVVGDDKIPDTFIPQLKLERWSNETNFSIRLVDDETGTETVDTLADKIVWEKGNKKIEFYDFTEDEGGYKLVWFLKKKPKTNKVEFTIQSKGLDFFYQPELTPEEIAEGAERPPEAVGSYAVYHQTKGGTVDKFGKDYKTGKAFHIYRPHLFDANGAEAWGILHIENGIYSVEIPQSFLDTAVYPIRSNDTFGYTSIGASSANAGGAGSDILFTYIATPGGSGTVSSFSAYFKAVSTSVNAKGALYNNTTLQSPQSDQLSISSIAEWKYFNVTGGLSITAIAYNIAIFADNSTNEITRYFDSPGGNPGNGQNTGNAYPTFPNPSSWTSTTRAYSIYATYTPSGGGSVNPNHLFSLMGCGN